MASSALAVRQTEPRDHGRELITFLGAEAAALPPALAEGLRAIAAIQDESAERIQTEARRPITQVDQINREENGKLTDRAIELALPADLPLVDALAMITAIQTRHALMGTTTNPDNLVPVDGNLFRHNGEDVHHPGEAYLPLVEGQHVAEGLKLLINELDAELKSSDLETAVIKACMYLNLALLLHSQRDFNGRVNRSFFDYWLSKTQPGDKPLRVFRNAPDDFVRYLSPAREEIGAAIFAKHFQELAHRPLFARFIRTLFRKLFTHTRNMGDVLAELPGGSSDVDGLFRNSWMVFEAEGVGEKDVEVALAAMEATGMVDTDDIFAKAKAMEKFDSKPGYFKEMLEASKVVMGQLIREVAPVLREMRERKSSFFTYYHFSEAYRELNRGNRPDPKIRSSIELVLWAMDQLKIY